MSIYHGNKQYSDNTIGVFPGMPQAFYEVKDGVVWYYSSPSDRGINKGPLEQFLAQVAAGKWRCQLIGRYATTESK